MKSVPILAKGGKTFDRAALSLSVKQQETWVNVVAFSWSGKEGRPAEVEFQSHGRFMEFDVEGDRLVLNLDTGVAAMQGEASDVPLRTF